MLTDLQNAVRALRAARATSITAWIVLTLAIASATVTFSVVDHVAVRRLPFPQADRLIAIGRVTSRSPAPGSVAPQDYFTWQADVRSLQAIGALGGWSPLRLTTSGTPVSLVTYRATASLFEVLRVRPALGRLFDREHEQTGGEPAAILSDAAWRRHFNADPGIVGRSVTFGRDMRTIVGVLPAGFTYPVGPAEPTDLWIPFVPRAGERDHATPGRSYMLHVVGRLRDGASVDQSRAEVERIVARIAGQYEISWKDARVSVAPLHEFVVGPARGWMLMVLAAVLLVLLVACANVANLLLARSAMRARELAVRAALGASRARMLRTAIVESLILSSAAAASALAAAFWGVKAASALLPAGLPRSSSIALDGRVLLAAVAATAATGLLVGIVPALQTSRADIVSALRGTSRSATASLPQARWRAVFLVAEVAVVVVMLFATTLFVTSFVRVVSTDLGFDYRQRVAFVIPTSSLDRAPRDDRPRLTAALYDDLLERVSRAAGVSGAAIVDGGLPLGGGFVQYSVRPAERADAAAVATDVHSVTPGYRDVMSLRLLDGRFLESGDRAETPRVVVLNDLAARQLFPGGRAVGRTVRWFDEATVVGVVAGARPRGPEVQPQPELYVPTAQGLTMFGGFGSATLVAHANRPAAAATPAIVAAMLPALPAGTRPPPPQYLDELFRRLTADRRFSAGLMTAFGVLALVIAAIGISGVMACIATDRTREIGVRLALGATRGSILRSVLAQTGRYLAAGLAIGLGGATATSGVLGAVLFGVERSETVVYAVVIVVVVGTGFVSALIPAARASAIDPLAALKSE